MALPFAVIVLIVVVLLGLMGTVLNAAKAADLGRPLRNRSLARSARRLAHSGGQPDEVERTCWRADDYARDRERLKALGYEVRAESITGPYVVHHVPGRGGGRTIRRRVPLCRVTYGRAQHAWGLTTSGHDRGVFL